MAEPARLDIQMIRDKIERCERDLSYARRKHAQKKQEFEQAEKELNEFVRAVSPLQRSSCNDCLCRLDKRNFSWVT
jgi:chromosome segregation ATPase